MHVINLLDRDFNLVRLSFPKLNQCHLPLQHILPPCSSTPMPFCHHPTWPPLLYQHSHFPLNHTALFLLFDSVKLERSKSQVITPTRRLDPAFWTASIAFHFLPVLYTIPPLGQSISRTATTRLFLSPWIHPPRIWADVAAYAYRVQYFSYPHDIFWGKKLLSSTGPQLSWLAPWTTGVATAFGA